MRRRLAILLIGCSAAFQAIAAEPDSIVRPVLSAYTLEVGSARQCDTYLTPLHYSGWQTALGYSRMQAMRHNPERNVMDLGVRLAVSRTLNPAHTAAMWTISFRPHWSMLWRYSLAQGFTLGWGGDVAGELGAVSLMRNGNNPVSVRAAAIVGVAGLAAWNGRLGRIPVTVSYRPVMPLCGTFFSPDYDELYYEIWLGNHRGLCHAALPWTYLRIDNPVDVDLHFGATTLRVGYRCNILSTKVAGIVTREVTHSFTIGVTAEWLSLRAGSSRTPDARIISALYE